MIRKSLLLLFVVPVVAFAAGPSLVPAEFAMPPAGTKLQWKNATTDFTFTRTAKEPEGYFVNYFNETGEARRFALFCKFCGAPSNAIDIDDYSKLFPLKVGNKVKVTRKRVGDPLRSWTHRISVEKTEMLSVPFSDSPLETYVIEEKIRGNYNNPWRGNVTYWYAPSLGTSVKIIDNANDDRSLVHEYQLINYIQP